MFGGIGNFVCKREREGDTMRAMRQMQQVQQVTAKAKARKGFCARYFLLGLAYLLGWHANAQGADWVLSQTTIVTATSTSELSQHNLQNSEQAINGVALATSEDSLSALTQNATISAFELHLEQSGNTSDGNVQAVNFARAQSMQQLTQSVTQTSGNTVLHQDLGVSSNTNAQAINYALASGNIQDFNQSFIGDALTLEKTATTPVSNLQAVNYARARSYSGNVRQSVNVQSLNVANAIGGTTDVRVNSLRGDSSAANVMQSVIIQGTLLVDPSTVPGVVLNHIRQ